jgi:predicted nucleic acid-binding protein
VTICVLDASVVLTWAFEDESSPYAEGVFGMLKSRRASVPPVWALEVNNGLLSALRRARITEAQIARFLSDLNGLSLDIDQETSRISLGQRILELGMAHNLTAYDASYLELAIRRGFPLATQDRKLADAALAAGVELLEP